MNRALRVLVIDHTGALGGAELALVRLVEALGPGIRVRCLLFADGPLVHHLRAAGAPVDVLALDTRIAGVARHDAGRASWGAVRAAVQIGVYQVALWRRLRRVRPDVVYTTSLKADLLATGPTLAARCALVWHVHDRIDTAYLPSSMVFLVRTMSRLAHEVIANSHATAETLPGRATVAYPGFSPGQGIAPGLDVPARSGPPVVTIIGRVSPTKGQLDFVRAAALIASARPQVRFRIVGAALFGEDDYAAQVRAEADELGVAGRITWVGQVSDLADELDRATCVVHASPVPEPFGQVVVEAMVRGVPVVATAAGGIPEILDARTALGELVTPGDVDGLAAAVLRVIDDPAAAFRRAEQARRSAYERFPIQRTAQVVSAVWRRRARFERSPRP